MQGGRVVRGLTKGDKKAKKRNATCLHTKKNVKKKGRPWTNSIRASPPSITDFPSPTRSVRCSARFTGNTALSSSERSKDVSWCARMRPGVSTSCTPFPTSSFKNCSVVPGRLLVVIPIFFFGFLVAQQI